MTLPDGTVIENVPEGTTQEEVLAKLKQNNISIRLDPIEVTPADGLSDVTVEETVTTEPKREPTAMESIKDVFTGELRQTPETESLPDWMSMPDFEGLTNLPAWKTALGIMLTNPEETAGIIKANFPEMEIRRDSKGNFIYKSLVNGKDYIYTPGITAGDIPRIASGVAAFSPAGGAKTILGQSLGSAATQGAIEGIEGATGGEVSGTNIGLAGALPAALGWVSGLKNIITKGAKGAPLPSLPQDELIQQAKNVDVPLMTSDVYQPSTFVGKTAQATGERIPFVGTGAPRVAQQEARADAVQSFFDDAGLNTQNRYDIATAEELIKKRGSDLTKYTSLKKDVFNKLDDKGAVETTNAIKAIDDGISELESLGKAVPPETINVLNNFKDSITNKSIGQLESVRKILGNEFQREELSSATDLTQKITNKVYRELNKDFESFIKANGDNRDVTKWMVANKRLSELANETRNTKLKNILNDGDVTPEKINSLLFSKNESDVKTLYKNLSPQGRENAKMAVIKKVYDDSINKDQTANPEKFITSLGKLQKQTGVIFNQEDKQKLAGLVRVLNATNRASSASLMTSTGQQSVIPIGAMAVGQFADSFLSGLAGSAAVGSMARVYESKPVRDLLVKLSKVKQYSKEEDELIQQISPLLQASKPKE